MNYVQCLLRNADKRREMSWIPEKFAVKGKNLNIKNNYGKWEDGWSVSETYGTRDADTVLEMRERYRHHREMSDI